MGSITLQEVLAEMDKKDRDGNPFPFDLSVWTLNRQSKTGGNLLEYKNAKLLARKKSKKVTHQSLLIAAQLPSKSKKNPNHFKNRTRNIELENGEIKKINIRLIDTFNGKKMQY